MLIGLCAGSSASAQPPAKLAVRPDALEVALGRQVTVHVELHDTEGRLAHAPRRVEAQLRATGAGPAREARVTFDEGEAETSWTFGTHREGLIEITASSPELREGGAFVQVVTIIRTAISLPEPASDPEAPTRPPSAIAPVPRSALRDIRERDLAIADGVARDIQRHEAERREAERRGVPPRLLLRASPAHGLLANGRDASTVYAFLSRSSGSEGMRVNLVPDIGVMFPAPLVIQPGRQAGHAELTAGRAGKVRVEFVGAQPQASLDGEPTLEVSFEPPIAGMAVHMPRSATLGDRVPIVVRLVDAQGDSIATDRSRTVFFALEAGRATLLEDEVQIAAGKFGARTQIDVDWWSAGEVRLSVASAALLTQQRSLSVRWPWLLLLVILAASAAGGFLAWTQGEGPRAHLARRLFSGLVAGIVLYTLMRFVTPREWVNNPFGAFLIAAVGGWLGTKSFEIATRTLFGKHTDGQG